MLTATFNLKGVNQDQGVGIAIACWSMAGAGASGSADIPSPFLTAPLPGTRLQRRIDPEQPRCNLPGCPMLQIRAAQMNELRLARSVRVRWQVVHLGQ